MQQKVSMVVPCFNKAEYIADMLQSVYDQIWGNIEVILVNDGSTDGTREIIGQWEEKLRGRGYDVVVVDQENKGLPAAIKIGLKQISGKYVCMPDCDDVLHNEYVSAMANILETHDDTMWVVCDDQKTPYDFESANCLKTTLESKTDEVYTYPYKLLESILLGRVVNYVWRMLVRTDYLHYCGLPELFCTEPRISQEKQVWIPMAMNGGKGLYLRQILYQYISRDPKIVDAFADKNAGKQRANDHFMIAVETLKLNGIYEEPYITLSELLRIRCLYGYVYRHNVNGELEILNRLISVVNESGLLKNEIKIECAINAGYTLTYRFISNCVIGYMYNNLPILRKTKGRIIAYAAFGRTAKGIIKGLLNSDIRPDVFWDIAASDADSIDNTPVLHPDFDNIQPNDIVLVLIVNNEIAEEIVNKLDVSRPGAVWRYYDILDYLTEYYFGERN